MAERAECEDALFYSMKMFPSRCLQPNKVEDSVAIESPF